MLSFYVDLAWRSFAELLTLLGANLLAIAVPVAVLVVTLLIKVRRGWREVQTHWVANVRDIAIATVVVWFGLFLWATTRIAYEDNQALSHFRTLNERLRKSNEQLLTKQKSLDEQSKKQDQSTPKPMPGERPMDLQVISCLYNAQFKILKGESSERNKTLQIDKALFAIGYISPSDLHGLVAQYPETRHLISVRTLYIPNEPQKATFRTKTLDEQNLFVNDLRIKAAELNVVVIGTMLTEIGFQKTLSLQDFNCARLVDNVALVNRTWLIFDRMIDSMVRGAKK